MPSACALYVSIAYTIPQEILPVVLSRPESYAYEQCAETPTILTTYLGQQYFSSLQNSPMKDIARNGTERKSRKTIVGNMYNGTQSGCF